MALIVTGFHRSGTSMMMQALKGAGLVIGDDLLPPGASNPDGHFEDRAIVRLHDAILHDQQGSWHSPPQDTTRISDDHASALGAALEPYITQQSPWGFKDPRTCLFLPWWQRQLPEFRQVFIYRNPLDCVRSLQTRQAQELVYHPKRNASALFFWENPCKALELWIRYNQAILDATLSAPDKTLLVSYEALIAGFPVIECANQQLGLTLNATADTRVRAQTPSVNRPPKQPFGLPEEALEQARELTHSLNCIAIGNQEKWAAGVGRDSSVVRNTIASPRNASPATSAQPTQTQERLQRMGLWQDECPDNIVAFKTKLHARLTPKDAVAESTNATADKFDNPANVLTHAEKLHESGQPHQAEELVVRQAIAFPDDCTLNIAAGRVWLTRKVLSKAEQHFRQAHAAAPRNKVPPMQLGLVARRRGDYEDACVWLQRAIDCDPHNPGLHALLAQSYQGQGNVATALSVTLLGLLHAPAHQKLLQLEAELLLANQQSEAALQRVRHLLTLYPECPIASKLHYHALAAQANAQRDESLPWFYLAVYRSMQAQPDYSHYLEHALTSLEAPTCTALRAQIHRELDRIHDAVLACTTTPQQATQSINGA